ncbi:MAG TPA: efflux RND transporter periplasmic adaptor subunit [Luteibacter sp.]|jgi:RND family efflux transporter MFP subunit|uniref:efflux RND transporter periplasmic adaptor subunit n=1 Tax=Luteibacter sp. TaxID=1886636 RepID=UPI002F41929F
MMRSLLAATSLVAVCLLSACDKPPRQRPTERSVLLAEVAPAPGAIASVLGQVRQAQRATLSFDMAGRVTSMAVHPGDRFVAGQVLATLDPVPARLRLTQARSEALAAHGESLERAEQLRQQTALFDDGAASQSSLTQARAADQVARGKAAAADAAVELAQRDLERSRILAPFAGTVVTRMAEPGSDLSAGQAVLAVEGEGELEVVASLPAALVSGLTVGDTAQLVGPDATAVSVRLSHLSTHLERGAITEGIFRVVAAPGRLSPGQWVQLRLAGKSASASYVAIPLTAMVPGTPAGNAAVFVFDVAHGQVVHRPVTVVATNGDRAVIGTGLSAGERVVAAGTAFLTDGQAVREFDGDSGLENH